MFHMKRLFRKMRDVLRMHGCAEPRASKLIEIKMQAELAFFWAKLNDPLNMTSGLAPVEAHNW